MLEALFHKTEAGALALKERERFPQLTPRMRSLLLQVDGRKTGSELAELSHSLGAPADCLDTLQSLGLIAADANSTPANAAPSAPAHGSSQAMPSDPFERLQEATRLMNKAASDYLGLKALFFTLKVEKCANRSELKQLLGELQTAVGKSRDKQRGELLIADIYSLLSE